MKTLIDSKKLATVFKTISAVVQKTASLPILQTLLVRSNSDSLEIIGTDLDIFARCTIPANISENGSFAANAARLTAAAAACRGDCEISKNSENVQILNGSSFKVDCLPVDEFPEIYKPAKADKIHSFTVTAGELRAGLMAVKDFQSDDAPRYVLNGSFFQIAKNQLVLTATDGRKMSIYNLPVADQTFEDLNFILPAGAVELIAKQLPKDKKNITATVAVKFWENRTSFAWSIGEDRFEFVCKLVDGNYPNYKAVLPDHTLRAEFNRAELAEILATAKKFTDKKNNSCTVHFEKNLLTVQSGFNEEKTVSAFKKQIPANYSRQAVKLCFNVSYLIDCLNSAAFSETIVLEFGKDEKSGPLQFKAGNRFLAVVMPIRLAGPATSKTAAQKTDNAAKVAAIGRYTPATPEPIQETAPAAPQAEPVAEPVIAYCTDDIEKSAGEAIAADLRKSGRYSLVELRQRRPEYGREFVRIYVQRRGASLAANDCGAIRPNGTSGARVRVEYSPEPPAVIVPVKNSTGPAALPARAVSSGAPAAGGSGQKHNQENKMKIEHGKMYSIGRGMVELKNPGWPVGQMVTHEDRANPRREFVIVGGNDYGAGDPGQKVVCLETGHETRIYSAGGELSGAWRKVDRILTPEELRAALATAEQNKTRLANEAKIAGEERERRRAAERAQWEKQFPHLHKAGRDTSDHVIGAKNIRLELARAFPGIKFSVRSDSYTGGSSIAVKWDMGPTTRQVKAITDKYQMGSFCGMEDIYNYNQENQWPDIFGGAKYVGEERGELAGDLIAGKLCDFLNIPRPADGKYYNVYDPQGTRGQSLDCMARQVIFNQSYPAGAAVVDLERTECKAGQWEDFFHVVFTLPDGTRADYASADGQMSHAVKQWAEEITENERGEFTEQAQRHGRPVLTFYAEFLAWQRGQFAAMAENWQAQDYFSSLPEPVAAPAVNVPAVIQPAAPVTGEKISVTLNTEKNGVEIRFPAKPAGDVLARLKAAGWRWSRFSACWYTRQTPEALALAYSIAGQAPEPATRPEPKPEPTPEPAPVTKAEILASMTKTFLAGTLANAQLN